MSTSAEMLRCPARSRRSRIQSGVGALAFTPRITRPEKRPHRSAAEIFTGSLSAMAGATGGCSGVCSSAPDSAASSRATPNTLMQCARLGVSLSV